MTTAFRNRARAPFQVQKVRACQRLIFGGDIQQSQRLALCFGSLDHDVLLCCDTQRPIAHMVCLSTSTAAGARKYFCLTVVVHEVKRISGDKGIFICGT